VLMNLRAEPVRGVRARWQASPCATVSRSVNKGGLSIPQLARVFDHVDSFLDHHLTVDELARVACLSKYHFGKAFRQSTGITVHQYVTSRRIGASKRLLSNAKSALADIAAGLGFANQSHFTAVFKARVGVPPGAYRKQNGPLRCPSCPYDSELRRRSIIPT